MARRDSEEPVEAPKPSRRDIKNRQLRILLLSILGVVVLAIAGVFLYQQYVAPFRKPVVTVDGDVIRMRYFLDRTKLAGNDPSSTLQQLVYEEIVRLAAPKLGATVSDSALDSALQQAAQQAVSANETQIDVSTSEGFKKWYDEQLKTSHLSDAQYREMVRVNIMATEIRTALTNNIPDTGEQVHLNVIVLSSSQDANKAKSLLASGTPFATVAKQMSIDSSTKASGGDAGWVPKGLLPYDSTIFALDLNKVSDVVLTNSSDPTNSQYLLFMVTEKDPARAIDPTMKAQLAQTSFLYWLTQEEQNHKITYELTANDQAWVNWQLAKIK